MKANNQTNRRKVSSYIPDAIFFILMALLLINAVYKSRDAEIDAGLITDHQSKSRIENCRTDDEGRGENE